MSWFQIVIAWLIHAAGLGALQVGQSVASPEVFTTYGDGRRFSSVITTTRVA